MATRQCANHGSSTVRAYSLNLREDVKPNDEGKRWPVQTQQTMLAIKSISNIGPHKM